MCAPALVAGMALEVSERIPISKRYARVYLIIILFLEKSRILFLAKS